MNEYISRFKKDKEKMSLFLCLNKTRNKRVYFQVYAIAGQGVNEYISRFK